MASAEYTKEVDRRMLDKATIFGYFANQSHISATTKEASMTGFVALMTSGMHLTDDLRNLLLMIAFAMIDEKEVEKRIKNEYCEGVVTTKFTPVLLGALGGIKFEAKIEMGLHTFKVHYIANPDDRVDPELLEWVTFDSNGTPTTNQYMN